MGLLKWLDHWTYERKLTRCEHCQKLAFCYYGVCLDIGNGTGNFCGMGCPACKKEQEAEREQWMEKHREPQPKPVANRRAAIAASREHYGQDESRA